MNGTRPSNYTRGEMSKELSRFHDDEGFLGLVEILDTNFAFARSMALKAAILLGVPSALENAGSDGLSLEEIAERTNSKNVDFLFRILRFLAKNKIFTEQQVVTKGEGDATVVVYKYGLTRASRWLLPHTSSFSPFAIMQLDKALQAPWHHFAECVVHDEKDAFARAHGKNIWSYAEEHPWFNDLFNSAMVSNSMMCTTTILAHYKGFESVKTLVDVGGGVGLMISKIISAYPHIKGINFDLPHVIATAPSLPGVQHVGGDMFKEVPHGDAILMKWIMHDWNDEQCTQILRNCHSALPAHGKLIIVDIVLDPSDDTSHFSNVKMVFDLLMIAHTNGGRERTEDQWHQLLKGSGFPVVKIHRIPDLQSVIEAFKG